MSLVTITSRRHTLVARCRDAADGSADEVLLDGVHLVQEALDAGVPLAAVVVSEGNETRSEIAAVLARAERLGIAVHRVTPAVLDAASPTRTPAGILALAHVAEREPDQMLGRDALVVVAVGIQDPGNVGTLVRSAEAAGATGLLTTTGTAHPFGWKALRASMGSALRLPIRRVGPPEDAVALLRGQGVRLVALDAEGAVEVDDADLRGPIALLAGSEGAGLPAAVRDAAHVRVRIPMRAPVESLNVGVAASLVLFAAARQRRGDAEGAR